MTSFIVNIINYYYYYYYYYYLCKCISIIIFHLILLSLLSHEFNFMNIIYY